MKKRNRRVSGVFLLILLVLFLFPADSHYQSTAQAATPAEPSVRRLAGNNRIETAVAISRDTFSKADTVVIATAYNFPDALAGVPLAYAYRAPLLLTDPGTLSLQVRDEIRRLGATKAVILGGTGAVSARVEADLRDMGLTVSRVAGRNRYETAVRIAEKLREIKGSSFQKVVVATGTNYADALAVSPYAACVGIPILLTGPSVLPAETENFFKNYGPVPEAIIIGGPGAVSRAVAERIRDVNIGWPKRVAGEDRIATALRIENYGFGKVYGNPEVSGTAVLATGYNFADALAGGVMAAMKRAPLFLTRPDRLDRRYDLVFSSGPYSDVIVLGGTGAVSSAVENSVRGLLANRKTLPAGWTWTGSGTNPVAVPPGYEIVPATGAYYKNGIKIRDDGNAVAIFTTVKVEPKATLRDGTTWAQQMATLREVLTNTFGPCGLVDKLMYYAEQKDSQYKMFPPQDVILTAPDGRKVLVGDDGTGLVVFVYTLGLDLENLMD